MIGLGDLAAAERVALELPTYATAGEYAVASGAYVLGIVALKRGDFGTAIEQLRRAAAPSLRNWAGTSYKAALAEAYLANGQAREAVRQLKAALSADPYRKSLYYELAVALETAGEPVQAAAEYSRFLDAWRDADPDAAFVADARERLAVLSTE